MEVEEEATVLHMLKTHTHTHNQKAHMKASSEDLMTHWDTRANDLICVSVTSNGNQTWRSHPPIRRLMPPLNDSASVAV